MEKINCTAPSQPGPALCSVLLGRAGQHPHTTSSGEMKQESSHILALPETAQHVQEEDVFSSSFPCISTHLQKIYQVPLLL